MKYQILFVTTEHLGDRAREVREAFVPIDGETVAELVERVSAHADKWAASAGRQPRFATADHIELRLQVEPVA